MDVKQSRNLTMLTDFYEITMAAGYFEEDYKEKICVFDMFFRKVPDGGGFAICAGVEQLVEALANLKFTEEDLEYLRGCNCFSEQFISYLRELKFTCDIWAIPEGTPIFPGEPIVTVEGPAIQAQLIETLLLVNMNHQSLIATKSSRICRAAGNRPVAEFGARRAQSYDAAVYGARAAYIGGVASTSCVFAARDFGIPASGTMAHSWVQMFPSELDAFKKYAELYPTNCILLVDTYNVIKSGIPNALRVFEEVLKPLGIRPKGVRIDSGDIAYLSKIARKMLDASGYEDVMIVASNSLDEYIVRDLLLQDAKVDSFGIGENLITSKSDPVFGGVYKLAAVKDGEQYIPKIKVSESVEKLTTPHRKSVWRIFDKRTGKALADYITIFDEVIDPTADITIFDPIETWKSKTFTNCTVQKIQVQLFDKGELVYALPALGEIRNFCAQQIDTLWDEVKRFEFPHRYYVDLSQKLWDERQRLLTEFSK